MTIVIGIIVGMSMWSLSFAFVRYRPQISTRTDCLSDIAYHDFVELIWGVDMALSGGDWYYDEIGVDGGDPRS